MAMSRRGNPKQMLALLILLGLIMTIFFLLKGPLEGQPGWERGAVDGPLLAAIFGGTLWIRVRLCRKGPN
jgi:hypothetical protein